LHYYPAAMSQQPPAQPGWAPPPAPQMQPPMQPGYYAAPPAGAQPYWPAAPPAAAAAAAPAAGWSPLSFFQPATNWLQSNPRMGFAIIVALALVVIWQALSAAGYLESAPQLGSWFGKKGAAAKGTAKTKDDEIDRLVDEINRS
jgi:hypothetical protein